MTKRDPELELLLRGGDLIALTGLDYEGQRERMRAVLLERLPQYTRRDAADPGLALVDALAACLDVMGFYHDRILTESKLGSAQLLESVARLGAAVGYRPLPPIAASAKQFFEAAGSGTVLAGTRVGGPGAVFATTSAIEIAPAVNRMELSPVLTLQVGARRAVIQRLDPDVMRPALAVFSEIAKQQQGAPASLPTDEFRSGMMAMLDSEHGLELCTIAASRRRGVGFARALLRSHDDSTTLARTTRARHLRFGQPLDESLVVFEVSELPILHVPDPAAPDSVTSTLEVFVFDEPPRSPEDWDSKAAWSEVADFSASKASDRHYRSFVDDHLTTYIILRRKLGYRTLIEDDRLGRVYARYTPAIGRVVDPPPAPARDLWDLDGVTLRLEADYLTTSMVRPKIAGIEGLHNDARWAVTKDDMGLAQGAQIAILGGASGATYIRTLRDVSERTLAWGKVPVEPRQSGRPANEFDPIDDRFDPAKGKIAPLADVASGQLYPLWEAYYKQAKAPDQLWIPGPVKGTEIPPSTAKGITADQLTHVQQIVYLPKGSTFLLLDDASHVKVGDYLLVGRRLKGEVQNREPQTAKQDDAENAGDPANTNSKAIDNQETINSGQPWFDPNQPWLTAEVTQALEVQGDLVRIKDPIAQDYYQDRLTSSDDPITEVIVVPRVASVYYGDLFSQRVKLTAKRTFIKINPALTSNYVEVALDTAIDPVKLRSDLELPDNLDLRTKFSRLFLAVEGKISEPPMSPAPVAWTFALTLPARGLAPEHVAGVKIRSTVLAVSEPPSGNATGGVEIAISSAKDAIAAKQHPGEIRLLAKQDDAALAWTEQGAPGAVLTQGQFRAASLAGWCLKPDDLATHETLLLAGGTLLFWASRIEPQAFAFAWQSPPPMLRLTEVDPGAPRPVSHGELDAVAIPVAHTLDITLPGWTANWRLPNGLFENTTSWMSSPDGVLELRYASSFRTLDFTIVEDNSDKRIELLDAALESPLDPLSGAAQLWALPAHDPVILTAGAVTAIWRFPVGDDVETAAPAGWTGPLVVIGTGKILRSATLDGPHAGHALTARLDGDATHDLQGSGAIHALLPDEAQTATPVELWLWTDTSPFLATSPSGAAALTFDVDPAVVLADIWQSDHVLRLIPRGAMAFGTNVATIVKYHATAVNIQLRTTDGPDTQVTFTLPSDWPSDVTVTTLHKLVTQKTGQASQILDLVDKPSSVMGDPGEATFRMKVPGDVTDEQIAIYLVVEGSSSGSVSKRSALHIVQPAWHGWVTGPGLGLVFLPAPIGGEAVSAVPAGAERVEVIGTRRSDGLWFVRDGSDTPLPTPGTIYLSPYTASHVTVQPATALRLGTLPGEKARIGFVGVRDAQDHWDAYPLAAGQLTSGGDVELSKAAPAVFPGGIANTAARFAYEVATYHGDPASTGLALHTANAGAVAKAQGANTAIFHTADFTKAVRGGLSTDGTNTRVHIEIDPNLVFQPAASPRFPLVSLGFGWKGLAADSLLEGSLILELGPPAKLPLELAAGDELTLLDGNATARTAKIIQVTDAGAYQLTLQDAPVAVRLHGLVAPLEALQVKVSFPKPDVLQEPWLLTFQGPGDGLHGGSIADTLLFHEAAHLGADNRLSFTLIGTDMLDAIAGKKPLHYYTNEVSQLHRDLYDGSLVGLSGTKNFLKSTGPDEIKVLLAAVNAADFATGTGPGPHVLLCSKARTKPLAKDDGYFESGTGDRELKDLTIPVLSQSIVFPSGDFIPVTGTLQDRDDKIIRNALRVWLLDPTTKQDSRLVIYEPRLTKIVELFDANNSWSEVCDKLKREQPQPPIDGLDNAVPSLLLYSFNKALGGAFTLNFLLIDAALEDHTQQEVRVYVEYSADRLPDDPADPDGRIYQFETRLLRLDPTTQLVVIDKGELKPDDYLFLHTAQQEIIQWTRVQSVTGVVIGVDPPVPFEIDSFRSYALRGFAKPPKPTALDKDYYIQAKDADLTGEANPTSPRPLVLADRLVLDPDAGSALLEAIIPGDRLLIWNETYRVAWNHQRVGSSSQDPPWNEWPDYQVEAVVKQVDAATGLVVLAEPLPERFQVAFSLVSHPDQAEAAHPDPKDRPPWYTLEPGALTLRVLPHYRAPFQGRRRMLTLGSGDRSRRFARFTGVLAPDPGLGTLPLSSDGAYASNIEVLARDPRSGDWSRWTELADINKAEKKDRAFTLGVDAAKIGTGQPVPFSASFGDGIKGQLLPTGHRNVFARVTAIGGRTEHVLHRRPLLILEAQVNVRVPFEVPPGANAAPDNLRLVIETGAPEQWSPAGRRAPWQPAMEIEVPQHGLSRVWREISQDEVCQGWDGFYVRGLRPGVVEVFFFTPEPLEPNVGSVRAWDVPDARLWALDAEFYADLARQDLTRLPGAKRLQLLETDGLAQGSLLALSQHRTGPTEIVQLDAVDPDTWSATLVEPIERTYTIGEAFLRGNLVDVVQGDTERVVLGSGDGSSLHLRLAVYSRAPLLHVLASGHTDPEPAVTVLVDGAPWSRVTELDDAGPRDHVYRVDVEADGRVFVAFGDGVHGAVPGAGNSNIVAVLGTGDGGAGNLAAGTVTKLLDGNLAVKTTSNLIDAAGGRRGDTADQAREALLGRSVAFDRIVSLEDVSRVAMEVGEVLHARVDPTAPPEILRLVVALVGRREATPAVRDAIQSRITDLMPVTAGITLQVDGAVQVPVHLAVKVTTGAGYVQGEVLAALRRAFGAAAGGFFAAERCPIAEPLRLGDVCEAIFAVPGVSAAYVTWMSKDKLPVSPHEPAPDTLDPGPDGVIRCDSDPRSDPDGERGTVTFTPSSGGAS